jgi:hypothetical protein
MEMMGYTREKEAAERAAAEGEGGQKEDDDDDEEEEQVPKQKMQREEKYQRPGCVKKGTCGTSTPKPNSAPKTAATKRNKYQRPGAASVASAAKKKNKYQRPASGKKEKKKKKYQRPGQSGSSSAAGGKDAGVGVGVDGYDFEDPSADHTKQGIAFDEAGDKPNSIRSFQAAAMHLNTAQSYMNLGVALMRASRLGEAEDR